MVTSERCNRCWNEIRGPIYHHGGECAYKHHNDRDWHCHDDGGQCIEGHEEHCATCHDDIDCRCLDWEG
jgi:hypothetical protein